ncbi:hypothetical protein T261_8264 [Streptomyces lydicus]|nr:hypothetical protein T261_8264 [Streptomyces lydicus]
MVFATDTHGKAARWTLEQGFTKTGPTTFSSWATTTRLTDSFGTADGAPPADWQAPALVVPDDGTAAVVRCTAPPGQKLAFTIKLRIVEALAATP